VQLRSRERLWLPVPPVSYRWPLIAVHHNRSCHAGVSQTFRAIRQHYHWPGMKLDVSAYVAQGHPCQLKRLATEEVASIRPPKLAEPLGHMYVDLAGPFPTHSDAPRTTKGSSSRTSLRGHAYICLIVDYFTKAAEFVAIPNKSAAIVAQAVHGHWFMRYGVPVVITTDNGTEVEGAFQHLLARLGVYNVHTSVRHAQSNGAAERLVRTLKEMLTAKAASSTGHWPSLLPPLRMEYMQRVHSTTKCSLNKLLFAISAEAASSGRRFALDAPGSVGVLVCSGQTSRSGGTARPPWEFGVKCPE
jgi:transposase InsO family protein